MKNSRMKVTLAAFFLFALVQAQASNALSKLKNEVQVSCQPSQAFFAATCTCRVQAKRT